MGWHDRIQKQRSRWVIPRRANTNAITSSRKRARDSKPQQSRNPCRAKAAARP